MSHQRRLFSLAASLFLGAALALRAQTTNGAQTVQQLGAQLEACLAQPKFSAALWGVKVVSLDSGKTLFEHHADRLMSPASNSKLYTGALALDQLGGDYRIATPVYADGRLTRSGTLRGNLIILGQGDPSWNSRRLGTNFWTVFDPFVAVLTNAGVRRVRGDLIADATYFQGPPTGSGWEIEDLDGGEMGLLSALTLDDNVAQIRVEPGAKSGARCQITPLQPGAGLIFSNQTVTVASNGTASIHLYHPLDSQASFVLGELPVGGAAQILDVLVPRPADWFAAALKIASPPTSPQTKSF